MAGDAPSATERMRDQASVGRIGSEAFRVMHDQMPIGMITVDRQGRIRHANPAGTSLLGYAAEELDGLDLQQLVPVPLRGTHGQHLTRFMRAPHNRQMGSDGRDFPVLRKDGSVFPAEIALSPVTIDGEPYVMAFLLDISERKRLDAERLRMQRKLEETAKLESLGILAGGIAHDFNNLLTGVLGNTELAQLELPADHALQAHLAAAKLACIRASDLCRQMLAYAGNGQYLIRPGDLNALVRETAELIRTSIGKQIQLVFALGAELPAVEIDEAQVRQVVMNLLINASDAIGARPGQICLRTGMADLATEHLDTMVVATESLHDQYLFLEVADTGCGISPENLGRIFDPFFTTKFIGRGLGLAAVQGIVRRHEGMLSVESTVGQGTRFRLLLPVSTAAKPEPVEPMARPLLRSSGATVLLVDDEPMVLDPIRQLLEAAGYRCLIAIGGVQALAELAQASEQIDLVLLDLSMPGLSGEETFARLRERHPRVKVVIHTGHGEDEVCARLGNLIPDGLLKKPALSQELLAMLQKVLQAGERTVPIQ